MSKPDSSPPNPQDLFPALEAILRYAQQYGAQSVDAIAVHGRSLSITARDGALEDVDNSEGRDIGLRVMVGRRQACVSSSDLSNGSLEKLAERAVAMAKLAPEDPDIRLADPQFLANNILDLDLLDTHEQDAQTLLAQAKSLEQAALAVDHVKQAEGASASASLGARAFMTSDGFRAGWQSSRHSLSVAAIAERDGAMERDYDYQTKRFIQDLDPLETIGTKAAMRAVARLGSVQMKSGEMPVVFDYRVAPRLLSSFLSAISGTAIARGVSFLKDALNTQVFAPEIQIIDDPHIARALGSRPFDGEGVDKGKTEIVKDGMLTTWLLNSATAHKLDLITTGHASRSISHPPGVAASNAYIANGDQSPQDIIKSIDQGLLVTEMFGPSINSNTGDYSVGVAGFAIENGERARPVSEITIASNLKTMFAHLTPANDLKLDRSISAPTLLVNSMVVAGE